MSTVITESALIQRLNRKLAQQQQKVCKPRSRKGRIELGDYYILDFSTNTIVNSGLSMFHLVEMAKEEKVMHERETVENLN